MNDNSKKITISGTNNRYLMKKLIKEDNIENNLKKRIVSQKWSLSEGCYEFPYQWNLVNDLINKSANNNITKIMTQEINKKISSYRHQDVIKNRWDEQKFITFDVILQKMVESQMKCRYCKCEMYILYDIVREMNQWSVDRIDNNRGHSIDNFHLACLDCNLKRRRRSDDKFLFTKQLTLIKKETDI